MPAPLPGPEPVAAQIARIRDLLPTTLGSREIREAIAADIRARSFFSARMSNAIVVSTAKQVVDQLAAGEIDKATARLAIMEVMRAVGYTPEGGFPDDPDGTVPPAVAGTLQDLSSMRRINFMLDTQLALVRGRGQQLRGSEPDRLRLFPAWELTRAIERRLHRAWGGQHDGSPPKRGGAVDPRPRWIIAGGRSIPGGRLIALKGDPVWGELGSSGNFDDALDVDFPPFAFNSGMRWIEVPRAECIALGVTGPNGETIDEWQAEARPTLTESQPALPPPQASVKTLDPAIRKAFEKTTGIEVVEDTATTTGNADEIRRRIAERRAAREARRQARGEAWERRAAEAYERRFQ